MNPKIPKVYICELCDYKTCNMKDYNKHKNTLKHINRTNRTENRTEKVPKQYVCECGKVYSARNSLWYHKKVCKPIEQQEEPNNLVNESVILSNEHQNQSEDVSELCKIVREQQQQMKEQREQIHAQQKQIQDLIPQLQQVTNITNNNNTNCNNKFNLNFFLNEQCKDAISIQHFIENLNIGIRELEHMGDVGYVKGMMSIFSETLGAMDIYKRPLHCTDLKRDTLYIKQGDTWTKDTEDKTELKKIVETVKCRNYGSLRLWEREHPEAFECDTQDNIDYMRISSESLGGFNSTDTIKLNKIIKHVVKEVYVK